MPVQLREVVTLVEEPEAAHTFFGEVLGLTARGESVEQGNDIRRFAIGEAELVLVSPLEKDAEAASEIERHGAGLHHVVFTVPDLDAERQHLGTEGIEFTEGEPFRTEAAEALTIGRDGLRGTRAVLASRSIPPASTDGKRLDHLAIRSPDYEASRRAWARATGLEVTNVIRPPAGDRLIAQIPAGGPIIEIIAPAGPDGTPVRQDPPISPDLIISMVAIEVPDIDEEVARLRALGQVLNEPAPGPLPKSRVARIPADMAHGIAIQLIAFDR